MSWLQQTARGRAGVSSGGDEGDSRARVWGVASLVQAVGDTLATRYGTVVVRGEISAFTRAASGHGYFVLKDEAGQASLRCAMFKRALSQVDFAVSEGQLVEARGQLSVYEARGELQMVVEGFQRAGAGAPGGAGPVRCRAQARALALAPADWHRDLVGSSRAA